MHQVPCMEQLLGDYRIIQPISRLNVKVEAQVNEARTAAEKDPHTA
jgi:hypothetical protein